MKIMRLIPIACLLSAATLSQAQQHYTVTDLGSLGGTYVNPTAVNSSGQVTGYAGISQQRFNYNFHAFLFSGGAIKDLGTLGGPTSYGSSITDSGVVFGISDTSAPNPLEAGQFVTKPFEYSNGKMTVAPPVPPVITYGTDSAGNQTITAYGITQTVPPVSPDLLPAIVGANTAGQVIGYTLSLTSYETAGFLLQGGVMTNLPGCTQPVAINNAGEIICPLYLYSQGTVQSMGTMVSPTSINSAGAVVGAALFNNAYRASLFVNSKLVDLNTLIPANSGWSLTGGSAINDAGFIVGTGVLKGQQRGFLLTPVK